MAQLHNEYINHSPYYLGQFGDQLESMTAQEVFNIAVEHLLLQNKKSISREQICLYDGDGVCCAAAPFIKDYNVNMENQNWKDITHIEDHKVLINSLQNIHDNEEGVSIWPDRLEGLAERFKLEMPQILIDKLNAK